MQQPRLGIILQVVGAMIFGVSLLLVVLVIAERLPSSLTRLAGLGFTVGLPLGFVVAFAGWLKDNVRQREAPPGAN